MGWSKTILVVIKNVVGFKMVYYIMANDLLHQLTAKGCQ